MQTPAEKSFLSPLRKKVIAAFLLACTAIVLAVGITYLSFNNLLLKVDDLSQPNQRLQALSNLFEKITRLDQQQRADAIKDPKKPYKAYLAETKTLVLSIDSLAHMDWADQKQFHRLAEMKVILDQRDYLLIDYLKLRSHFLFDRNLSNQLDSLATILVETKPTLDSSVTTTQKKTTTTTFRPKETEKKSFFSKIFGKKKASDSLNRVEVKEEVSVHVDTLAVARQDSAIREVGKIMKTLDEDQRTQSKQILRRELDLIGTNMVLINQLLSILKDVENEEVAAVQRNNREAALLVASSIERIAVILIVFFLLAAVLVFLIMMDISKSNYYRLKLIEAKELAEKLSTVKQRFLANMSHEIRTPLQSIIGFADQLQNPQVHDEAVNAIQTSSSHLLHIVNEMLDYSRIESDAFAIAKSPFQLDSVIDEVTRVIHIQAEKKGLHFQVVKSSMPRSKLLGDPFRIRQVFYNLLGNAVKFTRHGYVRFTIDIKEDLLVQCHFTIADSGVGIEADDLTRIFGQFEQGKSSAENFGGSGLGLTIVKKLVDLQGGHIRVESKPHVGTTFFVTLTFEKARDLVAPAAPTEKQKRILPMEKVWIVDDDPLILRFCSILLEKNKVRYEAFQQPTLALHEELQDVKVIFLDIRMPGISGTEVCKAIRKKNTKVRMIALTAHVLPDEQQSILACGFNGILIKPFRESDFLTMLGITSSDDSAVFDLSAVRKMTMGDDDLLHSILDQFAEETQKNLRELQEAVVIGDGAAAREIIHKLSGRSGQMGAAKISTLLSQLERQLDAGADLETLADKISVATDQLRRLLDDLEKEMVAWLG